MRAGLAVLASAFLCATASAAIAQSVIDRVQGTAQSGVIGEPARVPTGNFQNAEKERQKLAEELQQEKQKQAEERKKQAEELLQELLQEAQKSQDVHERSNGEMPQDQESYEAKIVALQKFVTTPKDQSNPFRNEQIRTQIVAMRKSIMPPARVVDWVCVVATVGRIFDKGSLSKGEVFCQTLSKDNFKIVTYRLIFDVVIPPTAQRDKHAQEQGAGENVDNVKFLSSLSRGDTIVFTGKVPTEDIYALTSTNLTNILMVTLFHEVTARKLHSSGETR